MHLDKRREKTIPVILEKNQDIEINFKVVTEKMIIFKGVTVGMSANFLAVIMKFKKYN